MLTAFVQLDPKLQELIALGVTAAVAFLVNYATSKLPWLGEWLGQHRVAITTWLVAAIVQIIQERLDKIPATWDSILLLVMQLIVEAVAVLVGFAYLNKKQGVQSLS